MNPEQLLAHFDRVSEAPDAIPRLRRFILELAVRGKLVPQDPDDEPASEIVKRIQTEKMRLVKKGVVGRQKPIVVLNVKETPFFVPRTWMWVPATLPAHLISDKGKKILTKDVLESGRFPVVDQGKVFIRGYCNDPQKVIHVEAPIILFGDHTRETKLIDFDFVVGADGVKLLQPVCLLASYYYQALQWLPLNSRGYGRHFKLLKAAFLPLPPLAEQHRIVAKIDELMALCDQLEVAREERERWRDRLAAASLSRIEIPEEDEGAFREHARFHLTNLSKFTHWPDQIPALRKTILDLAVRGKLVPQDPNDEPASELLKRIEAERAILVKEDHIRKQKPLSPIDSILLPYEIHKSWIWVKIGETALSTDYGTSQRSKKSSSGIPVLTMGNIQGGEVRLGGQKTVPATIGDLPFLYLRKYDLLYNRTNSAELVGKTGIFLGEDNQYTFASYLIRIRLSLESTNPSFFNLAMNAPYFRKSQIEPHLKQQCGQANVNGTILKNMLIPLPPIAEQHRIATKVDELMALCDRLEAQLTSIQTESHRLLEALLHQALEPALVEISA